MIPPDSARQMGWRGVDARQVAKAVASVFHSASLAHGGVLFECDGRVQKIGSERLNVPEPVHEACDRLIERGIHPALDAAKMRQTPFDLFELGAAYESDSHFRAFIDEARAHRISGIYAFPLRDFRGNLYVASGLRQHRLMTELEVRLVHSYCLDALDSLENRASEGASRRQLLTPREKECLVAAGRGQTEKDTARILEISPSTVHAHLESCKRKLSARNKTESIIRAIRLGVVRPEDL